MPCIQAARGATQAGPRNCLRAVVVSTELRETEIQISVADSGHGIAPEVAENLFRPFVTTKESGMGVGLSICRSIVEAHDGQLWAESSALGGAISSTLT